MSMFDVAVIGTGPAGVSAAAPLIKAGYRVLMIDGGKADFAPPSGDYLSLRFHDDAQSSWMIGNEYTPLRNIAAGSPKFRVPGLTNVFEGFLSANRIATAENFMAVGSLTAGGLSNAWGCGVAAFDSTDLAKFPLRLDDLTPHYDRILSRIGVSGRMTDDLTDYFGVDHLAQLPVPLDGNHLALLSRYQKWVDARRPIELKLGRARLAALTASHAGRSECNRSGLCLWGCSREAMYSARFELPNLASHTNAKWESGVLVDSIQRQPDSWTIYGQVRQTGATFTASARYVLLAAGTLASTRIAFDALRYHDPVRLLSNPIAAFLLWLPSRLANASERAVGLAQLSFVLEGVAEAGSVFGNLFSPAGLPVSEFLRHIPMSRRHGIDVLKRLLPSTIVGNCFFPGDLSDHTIRVDSTGAVHILGGAVPELPNLLNQVKGRLKKGFGKVGAFMLPGGFVPGVPGGDIHYAGTIPMRGDPEPHQAHPTGEVAGLSGVYVVDGAALSSLPAKAHTLTIMANASRIAYLLIERLESGTPRAKN